MSIVPFDLDSLSPEQVQYMQNKLLVKQNQFLLQQVDMLVGETKSLSAKIEIVQAEQQKTVEVAANSLRVQQGRFEYINLGDFGRFFSVTLSAVSVGRLLRIVGIAQNSKKGQTVPYRDKIPKYAQVTANTNYSVTQWHYERCMDKIDEWLKDNGYFERFYSIQTEKEMKEFVDHLFESSLNS